MCADPDETLPFSVFRLRLREKKAEDLGREEGGVGKDSSLYSRDDSEREREREREEEVNPSLGFAFQQRTQKNATDASPRGGRIIGVFANPRKGFFRRGVWFASGKDSLAPMSFRMFTKQRPS